MTAEMTCEEVRKLAPELALDISGGRERGAGLRHLTGCKECRQLVSELSAVGDELLMLAPVHEPPLGFQSRVVAAVGKPSRRRTRKSLTLRTRWVAVAAAVVIGVALGAGSMFLGTADDRQLAQGYRATLSEGQGSFFAAASLRGSHRRVGTVFGYEGRPSWVMVTLQPPLDEERQFDVQVVTSDGKYLRLGEAALGGDNEAWGRQIPVDLSAVDGLRFVASDGGTSFTATFDAASPWK
jgi:hypothetical protein